MNKEFEEWFKENYSELDPMMISAFKEVALKAWKAGFEYHAYLNNEQTNV